MTYRIPRADMVMSDPMPFNQHWEARIPVPISFIEDDAGLAFHAAFTSLQPGDSVTVCAFERAAGKWGYVKEVAEFRVTEKNESTIRAVRVGDVFEVPAPKKNEIIGGVIALDIVPVRGAFEVRDRRGNVVGQGSGPSHRAGRRRARGRVDATGSQGRRAGLCLR